MTVESIRKMKHALGFDNIKPKSGKFEAYRNYYDAGQKKDADWEESVREGYAERVAGNSVYRGWWYRVTPAGIKMLEEITGLKIIETK